MVDTKSAEDLVPEASSYPYAWSPDSAEERPLDGFLNKFKPSMVQDDGTKPWIWVQGKHPIPQLDKNEEAAIREALECVNDATKKIDSIKNDPAIPTRASKKNPDIKSKKECRELEQAAAVEKLKEISLRHGYVSGKWLIFAPPDKVDFIWTTVATSLVSGPLSSTAAFLAKVSTCPPNNAPNYQHVMCVYMPNAYDKEAATEMMRALIAEHGLNVIGVKSNLYTAIGLDSKHPSGIQSTIWKPSALIPDAESKAMREAFFDKKRDQSPDTKTERRLDDFFKAEPVDAANPPSVKTETHDDKAPPKAKAKAKPMLKRKAKEEDMFVSDEEDDAPAKTPASSKKAAVKKAESDDDETTGPMAEPSTTSKRKPSSKAKVIKGEEEEEDEKPKPTKPLSKSKPSSRVKRSTKEEDIDEEDEVIRPKKRGRAK
ncbi:uncharacterized protein STEHIDRAFT_99999 [Stereum hirsutum FP-91666 SS1]|uniref:uncharacterized protein n=1 Tax=Stereum hirsutum (strain FP-91666) TaxID=721885 RepID=UPI000444A595|nr:uncharacterized protein STEHIDRAFT_99999 [Stereum hirsutum FP-91666 SS1]EIM85033.1 hypothetical protein STEHIDRAFT_99999 [Stereum hirsutum FP-91666 SS1]